MTHPNYDFPPVTTVWGTALPEHWYNFLKGMADQQHLTVYTLLRQRMLDKGLTDNDIEIMAERARIPTLNQKQRLIEEHFKADGLPPWRLPLPKVRRVLMKPRRAMRDTKAPIKGNTIHGDGVWVKLTPAQMKKAKDVGTLKGMPPQELLTKLITNWLAKQPDITPSDQPEPSGE